MEKEDYRTVMLVKKISQGLLAAFGLISSLAIILFINQFVNTRGTITSDEALIYRNVYYIMTISILTVPILSSYRGFFQGIKKLYGLFVLASLRTNSSYRLSTWSWSTLSLWL